MPETFPQLLATMQISQAICFICLLFQIIFPTGRGWQVLKNDATEIIPEYTEMPVEDQPLYTQSENDTMSNRAQQGDRRPQDSLDWMGKKNRGHF